MIRLQGKYRLTFPVTPGEIHFKGYGNDTETTTAISMYAKNRLAAHRAKAISFDFWLPGDPAHPLVEVAGYQGPREWLAGLDRLVGAAVLLTIEELDLAWNVLIGPCDGAFKGKQTDYYGTIEFPIYIKDEFVSWSNSTKVLVPGNVIVQQRKARPNTTRKTAKKNEFSFLKPTLVSEQKLRIENKKKNRPG